jgi:hypothetical protein
MRYGPGWSLGLGLMAGVMAGGCVDQMQEQVKQSVPDMKSVMTTVVNSPGARDILVQGSANLINPKLVGEFEGFWVVGIKGRASYGLEGGSGNGNVSARAPNGINPQPSSQPAGGP